MLAISSVLLGAILGLVPAATTVRLAQRKDLLPLAALLYDSFAAPEDSLRPYESRTRSWWDAQTIKLRIAMDLEQRMTPWVRLTPLDPQPCARNELHFSSHVRRTGHATRSWWPRLQQGTL